MKSANWYFKKINWSNLLFAIKQKRVFELWSVSSKMLRKNVYLEKGKLQNMIRNTEKKEANKTKTKQTKQTAKTNKKMRIYEMICKQTMRL